MSIHLSVRLVNATLRCDMNTIIPRSEISYHGNISKTLNASNEQRTLRKGVFEVQLDKDKAAAQQRLFSRAISGILADLSPAIGVRLDWRGPQDEKEEEK